MPKTYEIVRYRTARECLAAYHGCKPSEVPISGRWEFADRDGKVLKVSARRCYRHIIQTGCWGFCEDKGVLHLWVSRRAKPKSVMALIAHEVGHCQKPFLNRSKEEMKAAKYEHVCEVAFDIFQRMMR
jgi:hypothetical protein